MTQDYYDPDKLNAYDVVGELVYENRLTGIVRNYPEQRVKKVPYYTIDLYQGDDRTIRVYVKDPNLDIIDLTGATGLLTVKEYTEDTVAVFTKSTAVPGEGQIGAANKGEMFFYIVPGDTVSLTIRQYVFSIRVTLSNGKTYTIASGVMNLQPYPG